MTRTIAPVADAVVPTRRLLLVRHGLPDYTGRKSGDVWPGPPLSALGRVQAAQAAAIVADFSPPAIYTSPLTRCVDTARIVGAARGIRPRIDPDLREWHRAESLYDVSVRLARWLAHWLRRDEPCAVVVSHASPLLAIIRSALYVPHVAWHKAGYPDALNVSSVDQLEVSMASVFQLVIGPDRVSVRRLLHPTPRIQHASKGRRLTRLPRPVPGHGENQELCRRNVLSIVGGHVARPGAEAHVHGARGSEIAPRCDS